MCVVWMEITYSAMLGWFIFMNPLFTCNGGVEATEIEACRDIGQCDVTNNFTATYYVGLYCQKMNIRSALQSIYAIGALIGMFGVPALADVMGRKFSFMSAFVLQLIGISMLIAGVYENIVWLMLFGQLLTGIFAAGVVVLTYLIVGELCSDKTRQAAIMLFNSMWGLT